MSNFQDYSFIDLHLSYSRNNGSTRCHQLLAFCNSVGEKVSSMSCHIHRHRQHTTYIHVGASPLDINLYFFQGCPMTAHNPRRKDYQRDAFDAVLLILNKWILSNICLFHLPEGSQPISKKILRLADICIFPLFEVPRDPVLVPMSTGTTQMSCTCFEKYSIFQVDHLFQDENSIRTIQSKQNIFS